ncbi:MAG: hypothetical protein ACOCUF_00550 [Patescibacteria group bacterium]
MSNNHPEGIYRKSLKFWKDNEERLLFVVAIILVAFAGFKAGETKESSREDSEIKVAINNIEASNPRQQNALALGEAAQRKGVSVEGETSPSENKEAENKEVENEECPLVGSENSDKYHSSDCTWAEKIKPENRVCFSSEEEAEEKGYKAAGCCF